MKVKFNKKEIDIPEYISVGKYQELHNKGILQNSITPTPLVSNILGITENELKKCDKKEVEFISQIILNKLTKDATTEIVFMFEYNGIKYGLDKFERVQFGTFVDMEVILSSDNLIDEIHNILALLYRPVISQNGTKYTIEDYDGDKLKERSEVMKQVPIHYWLGVTQFFFSLVIELSRDIQVSLMWKKAFLNKANLTKHYVNKFRQYLKEKVRRVSILTAF